MPNMKPYSKVDYLPPKNLKQLFHALEQLKSDLSENYDSPFATEPQQEQTSWRCSRLTSCFAGIIL